MDQNQFEKIHERKRRQPFGLIRVLLIENNNLNPGHLQLRTLPLFVIS